MKMKKVYLILKINQKLKHKNNMHAIYMNI